MNKPFFVLLLAGLLSFAAMDAFAQDSKSQPISPIARTSTEGGRFEIVVTTDEDISRVTYKVDKYTGTVWELSSGFRPLKFIRYTREADPDDLAEEGKVNYQFVALSSSTLFLINLNTGVTWEKTPDDLFKKKTSFQVIREQ